MLQQNLYTVKLTSEQGKHLQQVLAEGNYKPFDVAYSVCAVHGNQVSVVLYQSGKLVVQGKGASEFVEFVLEPLVLKEARIGYEEVLDPTLYDARIGVDESGKGDYFGPLCIAGVYVNESVLRAWAGSGIQDSKAVGNDQQIAKLAVLIRGTPGVVQNVVSIGNEAYNRLYQRMRNGNKILAWGHARVIENLLALSYQMSPAPKRAISDQFAATGRTVESALMQQGRKLPLVQMHKAESDMAVAAASILARDEFVRRLKKLGDDYEMTFPKGATSVIAAGKEFVQKHDADMLVKVAKVNFRTTQFVTAK